MMKTGPKPRSTAALAASITGRASRQTYLTIRLLADRDRVDDAYRAYAYFRWVDDELDAASGAHAGSGEFVQRQASLVDECYGGGTVHAEDCHEEMLIELVRHSGAKDDGLQIYLREMMAVMAFDAARRGRLISQAELTGYTGHLARAVTEALHHFIGRGCSSPHDETRYLAVSAAHITHMLRDTLDDVRAGYYNIPREMLEAAGISPADVSSGPYRAWVRERVQLARTQFDAGGRYLRRVQNPRCRLACLAYVARFTGVLDAIERDAYCLRPSYAETKGLRALLRASAGFMAGAGEQSRQVPDPARIPFRERLF